MGKVKARLDITADPPILVDGRLCDHCGGCIGICPADCLTLDERSLNVIGSMCIKCGFCIPACPVSALAWNEPGSFHGRGLE